MQTIVKTIIRSQQSFGFIPRYEYHFAQTKFPTANKNPAATAKRIIKVVGERLRKIDPERTHWNNEGGFSDIATCIHVHDALEKEFGMEVRDRAILITDIGVAFYIVMLHHDSI